LYSSLGQVSRQQIAQCKELTTAAIDGQNGHHFPRIYTVDAAELVMNYDLDMEHYSSLGQEIAIVHDEVRAHHTLEAGREVPREHVHQLALA